MKKIVALLLSVVLIMSVATMTACSKKSGDSETANEEVIPDTKGGQLYSEFVARIDENSDIAAVAEELCAEEISGYSCAFMEVEEGYLNGFNDEITGFTKGVVFGPVIGSIPFVAYIFESEDPAALKTTLLDHADPRWNICTEADETLAMVHGDYVFFVMLPNE